MTLPAISSSKELVSKQHGGAPGVPSLNAEFFAFLEGFKDPNAWFLSRWMPRYQKTIEVIEVAVSRDRAEDLYETIWKTADNAISHAGQGLLKFEAVDELRENFIQVIRDIHADGSADGYERIVQRFEAWKADERIRFVPRLLIARAFAGIHPKMYHTTVDAGSQNEALAWFAKNSGFVVPRSKSWAARARALTKHLDRTGAFGDDFFGRNIFPWFVVDQLRARRPPFGASPGHTPRPSSAFAKLTAAQRVIALRHNAVQTVLAKMLEKEFGATRVWTERPTGTGGYADAVVLRADGKVQLYEIKIADTAAAVVRQAMGQLLEYGFRSGGLEPERFLVVGEPVLDEVTHRFLVRLQSDFSLPIYYMQVDLPQEET